MSEATVGSVVTGVLGNYRTAHATITLSNDYAEGGDTLDPNKFSMREVHKVYLDLASASPDVQVSLDASDVTEPLVVVSEGSTGEQQTVTLALATGGTFTLSFDGDETSALAFDAAAATVQTALRALDTLSDTDVSVSGSAGGPYTVTFSEHLGEVPALVANAASLTAATATATVATTQAGGGGPNETQTVTVANAVGGTFTLTYSGQTTSAIAYNATAAAVDTALEALSNIDPGDVTCTGGPLGTAPVAVEFTGALANTNVAQMTDTDTALTEATPTVTVAESQAHATAEVSDGTDNSHVVLTAFVLGKG